MYYWFRRRYFVVSNLIFSHWFSGTIKYNGKTFQQTHFSTVSTHYLSLFNIRWITIINKHVRHAWNRTQSKLQSLIKYCRSTIDFFRILRILNFFIISDDPKIGKLFYHYSPRVTFEIDPIVLNKRIKRFRVSLVPIQV